MNLPRAGRWLVGTLLLAALAALMAQAAVLGWADFNGREARFRLDQAISAHQAMDGPTWERTRALLEATLAADPGNAMYTEDLANLYFLRAAGTRGDGQRVQADYEHALSEYLRAASLRPTSSYTHANIATVKLRLGQFDQDFTSALTLAAKYGPWEPPVQEQVITAGMLAWGGLPEPVRDIVRDTLRRAYQLDARRTLRVVAGLKSAVPGCEQLRVALAGICPSK